jgi:hypothetical protein
MGKNIIVLSCLFVLLLPKAHTQQNLVPNPSFEDTLACPQGPGDVVYSTGWMNSGFTPDYYHSCANINYPSVGTPQNWVGYQAPFHGNSYMGIITWDLGTQREFIGIELTTPLASGMRYFVSAYIARADSVDVSPYTCSCNKFGFRFSNTRYEFDTAGTYVPADNYSHVSSDSIITNTTEWTKISGSFVADSTYRYLYIGNSYDNSNTDTLLCSYSGLAAAYYYVDAVCVSTDSLYCVNYWTGTEDISYLNEIAIYPNPVHDILTICGISKAIDYSLISISGQILLKGKLENNISQINISSIALGAYILNIESKYFKIVITH